MRVENTDLPLVSHHDWLTVLLDVRLLQDLGVLLGRLAGVVAGQVVHLPADPLKIFRLRQNIWEPENISPQRWTLPPP